MKKNILIRKISETDIQSLPRQNKIITLLHPYFIIITLLPFMMLKPL